MRWLKIFTRKGRCVPEPVIMRDPKTFFAALKPNPFARLSQSQVDGINALLSAMHDANWPLSYAAYALATAKHETAATMRPIKEHGGRAYFTRMYDIEGNRPHVAKRLGNTVPGDGARFAGRGYVQLTGRANYQKAGTKIGADLIGNPDRAMEPDTAAKIMVCGMAEGWFTGKKLANYLPTPGSATFEMFRMARRIINGTDKDAEIALIAMKFQDALRAGGWK